jgi:hypothetical protein
MNLAQIRQKTLELLGDAAEGSSTFAPSGDYTNLDAAIQWAQEQAASTLGSTFYFEASLPVVAQAPPAGMPTTPGAFGGVAIPSDLIELVRVAIGASPIIPQNFQVTIPLASAPVRTDGIPVVFNGEIVVTGGFSDPITIFAYLESSNFQESLYVYNVLVDSIATIGDGYLYILTDVGEAFQVTCTGNSLLGLWPNGTTANGRVVGVDSTGFSVVAMFSLNGGNQASVCGVGLSSVLSVSMNGESCVFSANSDNELIVTIPDDLFGMDYPFTLDNGSQQFDTDNFSPNEPTDSIILNDVQGFGLYSFSNPVITTQ